MPNPKSNPAGILDMNLAFAARQAGHETPELICIHTADAPRRSARGREQDRLVLYLAMDGNALLPPGKQDQALAELAKVYYSTPGAVTSAMRRVIDAFNESLLERNRRLESTGRQGVALLAQMVLRGVRLTLAHSGPLRTFLVTAGETRYFYDPDMADLYLGQSKMPPVRFFQVDLAAGDTILTAAQPAPDWNETMLANLHGQGPESLRRRLFSAAVTDLNAFLLQVRPGKGAVFVLRGAIPAPAAVVPAPVPVSRSPEAAPASTQEAVPAQSAPVAGAPIPVALAASSVEIDTERYPSAHPETSLEETITLEKVPSADTTTSPDEIPEIETGAVQQVEEPLEASLEAADSSRRPAEILDNEMATSPVAAQVVSTLPEPALDASTQAAQQQAAKPARAAGASLAALGRGLTGALGWIGQRFTNLFQRLALAEVFAGLPSSMMAFIALALPLALAVMAGMAYLRLGKDVQYETTLAQAQRMAARGLEQQDVTARRADLETALGLLHKAEGYHTLNPETLELRNRLQNGMDELDLVERVDYLPAIQGALPTGARITSIALVEDDLYLLDISHGKVIRAMRTSQGFEIDPSFDCGPGPAGISSIGPLVDMSAWPGEFDPKANVVAFDATGGLLYCREGEPSNPERLALPAENSWGQVTGMAFNLADSFVLDPLSTNLWIFRGSEFKNTPINFFIDNSVDPPRKTAPMMDDVIDLAANRDDVYLLHQDGQITLCTYSGFELIQTNCTSPHFIDFRPGRENLPLTPPAPFIQILNTRPPDPSLFLLEAQTQSIYHFSLRNLAFQRQYLPRDPLPGNTTAFLVDNLGRYLYLAVGNQIYHAILP